MDTKLWDDAGMTLPAPSLVTACLLVAGLIHSPAVQAQAGAACAPGASDTASRNACAVQRFQQADSAQNILYGDVMRALSAHERPALRKDQSAWSRQRTSTCKARHASDEGRADWPQRLHDCLTQQTEARHATLRHWLHHGEAPP